MIQANINDVHVIVWFGEQVTTVPLTEFFERDGVEERLADFAEERIADGIVAKIDIDKPIPDQEVKDKLKKFCPVGVILVG